MAARADRTLVKSPPELWELATERERMESWTAALLGASGAVPVEVTAEEPEELLVWRASDAGDARVEIAFAKKGFGTRVAISVECQRYGDGDGASAVLEGLLDELASPERRPFARD